MKSLFNAAVVIACVSFLSACSTFKTNELTPEESGSLQGKSMVLSQYRELPTFVAQTPTNVQFGYLGLMAAKSNGNKMIVNNEIEDPARNIAAQLAERLQQDYKLDVVESGSKEAQSDEVGYLVDLYKGYDYVLDVKTLGWRSMHFATDWNNYRVFYAALARLIDAETKTVIAEGICDVSPKHDDSNDAPSYEELENGDGLRRELATSVDSCVEVIVTATRLDVVAEERVAAE